MKFMKKSLWLLPLVLVSLAACSNGKQASTPNSAQSSSVNIDNYGRTLTLAAVPEKVLTFGPNCTELFCALGLESKVVGDALNNHSRGPLLEYQKAYASIPELTYGEPTREAVLSSGADFVYGIDWAFGSEGVEMKDLTDSGITVYENSAHTIAEMYQEITDLGTIFDVEKQAEAFISDQKARIEKVAETKVEEKTQVLVYDSGESGVFTASGKNFASRLIEAAGGENIFNDLTEKDWVTVSTEEVLARNPEVIVVLDYDSPSSDEKIKKIKSDGILAQLDAVKNQKFVVLSLENFLPGPRMAVTVEELAKTFTAK